MHLNRYKKKTESYYWKDPGSNSKRKSSFIVTALNPKGIDFFVAFLSQFISPNEPVFNTIE
jgi:threonine/homoserine/homoserine lactone efflux protein